jgi:hypothetical protein
VLDSAFVLRAALIGFPSSGKTTLFRLMTRATDAPRGHARADTVVGISKVPDARLDALTTVFRPRKRVPAAIEFADHVAPGRASAAALVEVAAYQNADALVHVVRAFRDPSVPHPSGSVDPARDAQAMEDELILADLGVVERRLERVDRERRTHRAPDLERERALLGQCHAALERGQSLRALELGRDDAHLLRGFHFLSAKALLIAINLDEADCAAIARPGEAARTAGLEVFLSRSATLAVPVCARIELEIAALDPDDSRAFLEDLGLAESGIDRVIRATYELTGYISFFTVGDAECHAWSIPRGTMAVDAAAEVHTDMARGFIRAEVVPFARLAARGSMAACREHGEVRLEGRDYVVQDGDVITFRHAT